VLLPLSSPLLLAPPPVARGSAGSAAESPRASEPQVNTWPAALRATAWCRPQATSTMTGNRNGCLAAPSPLPLPPPLLPLPLPPLLLPLLPLLPLLLLLLLLLLLRPQGGKGTRVTALDPCPA
jgi:hypothetical protein